MALVEITSVEAEESDKLLRALEEHFPQLHDHLCALHARLNRQSKRLGGVEQECRSLREFIGRSARVFPQTWAVAGCEDLMSGGDMLIHFSAHELLNTRVGGLLRVGSRSFMRLD
jgi:hypothetical protein